MRPPLIPPRADGIPQMLKDRPRWAPWQAEWNVKRNKYDKVPHRCNQPEYRASTNTAAHWGDFNKAWRAYERSAGKFAGVGFCLTGEHDLVAIDLDSCVVGVDLANGAGGIGLDSRIEIAPWAAQVIEQVKSYTELSPTGSGIHIFALGKIAHDWMNHEQGIEVYNGHEARFLTVTGVRAACMPV